MQTADFPGPEPRRTARYNRAAILHTLKIPGTDPWVSQDELIQLGRKPAIGAAIRLVTRLTNHLNNLDAEARAIAEARSKGLPDPVGSFSFSDLRRDTVRMALREAQAELQYLLARPDCFWRALNRRRHFSTYTETAWRSQYAG